MGGGEGKTAVGNPAFADPDSREPVGQACVSFGAT